MIKRLAKGICFFAFIICVTLSICVISVADDIEWDLGYYKSSDKYDIGLDCREEVINIPFVIKEKEMKRIHRIFHTGEEKSPTKKIVLPEGVEVVGYCDNHGKFENLEEIVFPSSLREIAGNSFRESTIKRIVIPENVRKIEWGVVSECDRLSFAEVKGNVMGMAMFEDCPNLQTVILSGKPEEIPVKAFNGCKSLREITIPEGVKKICPVAFARSGLESIIIPESVTNIDTGAFAFCENLKSIVLKNPHTAISEEGRYQEHPNDDQFYPTFYYCNQLSTIYAPYWSEAYYYAENKGLNFVPVVKVEVNGKAVKTDMPPIIENGRVLIPARAIFEALGASVEWDEPTKTVTARGLSKTVCLQIDNPLLNTDGRLKTMDVTPKIIMGRTMVPTRAVSESLDADVVWDEAKQTVYITAN